MLRSSLMLSITITAIIGLTGCGKSTPSSASSSALLSAMASQPTTPQAPIAQGYDPKAMTGTATQTGSFSLTLSSLKAADLGFVEVALSGAGLATPVTKRLSATDMASINTLAFDHIPAGTLQASLTELDKNGKPLGSKAIPVTVQANQETKLQLKLTTNPAFGFSVQDPKVIQPTAPEPSTDDATGSEPANPVTTEPATPVTSDSGALAIQITDKSVVRKFLLFKKLSITLKVTNTSSAQSLNGQVSVVFHKMKGIFAKEDTIVETVNAPVDSLAPGKSIEIKLQSTVAADDAEATVHTIVASSSASTGDN